MPKTDSKSTNPDGYSPPHDDGVGLTLECDWTPEEERQAKRK